MNDAACAIRDILPHGSVLLAEPLGPRLAAVYESIHSADFTGYDPGTLYYTRVYLRLLSRRQGKVARLWNGFVQRGFRLSGFAGARLVRPAMVRSTKALALCLSGFAALRALSSDARISLEGERLVRELLRLRDPAGYWRPDFRYVVRGSVVDPTQPAPCLINSVFVCQALLDWGGTIDGVDLGAVAREAACSLVGALPRYETDRILCVTYHPAASYYVHNANLLLGSILAQVGELDGGPAGSPHFVARQAAFLAEDLSRNALVPYAAEPTPNATCDNYHTGFVLRALTRIQHAAPSLEVLVTPLIHRVWRDYRTHFFDRGGVYRFIGRSTVQAHSLAEVFLILAQCASLWNAEDRAILRDGARLSIARLWDQRAGYFINEAYRLPLGVWRRDVTPMPRWSWSWMFFGLASLAQHEAARE